MHIDQFILRLAMLLVPGVAGYKVYKQLRSSGRTQKQFKDWEDFLNVLLFSLVGYLVMWTGTVAINFVRVVLLPGTFKQVELTTLRALLNDSIQPNYFEILVEVVATAAMGVAAAWITNRKWTFKFFQWIKVTNHFGDDDVWSFIMNSDDLVWAIVRDHRVGLAYVARIDQFSDSGEKRELVLGDVDVRDNSSWRLRYKAERLYISRADDDLSIEILNNSKGRKGANGKGSRRRIKTSA